MNKIKLSKDLEAFLLEEDALEAFELNTLRHFKGTPKREFKKITEGFNFANAKPSQQYWVALTGRAPKSVGGLR
jgi:hypothetical protein